MPRVYFKTAEIGENIFPISERLQYVLWNKSNNIPDGKGVTYNYRSVAFEEVVPLDDDLVLWFTKRLR